MLFAAPMPFQAALDSAAVRSLLPTSFRTQLLQQLPAQLRERALFSAGVTNAELLQKVGDSVNGLLTGQTGRAEMRAGLKQLLGSLGDTSVDDSKLTDLRSDARLNLILDTNVEMAQGYGQWKQGQDPAVLDEWPAQELIRVRDSRVPRDWPARWAEAGGTFYGARMIALKNDPIWTAISRFGLPYPPFDFNSGMDVQDVDRDTAVAAGLIDEDTELQPQDRGFNADLQASPDVREVGLKTALEQTGLGRFDAAGVFRFLAPEGSA